MVLSTTKRTSSLDSIVNRDQGGGSKKAGLPKIVGRDSWTSIHFTERGTSQFLKSLVLTKTVSRQSRPIHVRPSEYRPKANQKLFSML
jgi:hypothetical protein